MIHLSPELVSLTQRSRTRKTFTKEMDFGQYCTSLYCEFYGVVSDIHQSLERFSNESWTFTTDLSLVDEKDLTFSYGFLQEKFGAQIDLVFQPFGTSYIALNLGEAVCTQEHLEDYARSSAFKRYFSKHQSSNATLMSLIPQKQLTSRFIGDYILHLLELMLDFVDDAQIAKSRLKSAA